MFRIINTIKNKIFSKNNSSENYVTFLKEKRKITIGEHCVFYDPSTTFIDAQRPHMLYIGDYVKITRGVTILCHDYSRSVLSNMPGNDFANVGEADVTWIGNNCFIGINSTILMGAHIGNNCIVGAASVVSGNFPDNVVIAGNPAKVICTIEEFYNKREEKEIESAKLFVKQYRKKFNRDPDVYEMTNAFAWLYLPHTKETLKRYPSLFKMTGIDECLLQSKFLSTNPTFSSFEEFLDEC